MTGWARQAGDRHGPRSNRRAAGGFSYLEVMVAALVLAICLPPALEALGAANRAAGMERAATARRYRLAGRLEDVLAQQYAALDTAATAAGGPTTPTSYSDAMGTTDRRLIFIARYDIDNADADGNVFTGGDAGLLWVRIALENAPLLALETLVAP